MKIINKIYNIDKNVNKTLIHISDLHFMSRKDISLLNLLLDNIKNQKPDYICITGDFVDKHNIYDEEVLLNWLKKLSTIAKTIISIGNHEFYVDKKNKVFKINNDLMEKISKIENVYLLDNKNIILDNINFIGLTVPMDLYYTKTTTNEINELLNKLKTNDKYFNILLCHSPKFISDKNVLDGRSINLILCGHMHGGAVPTLLRKLFGCRGIISPDKRLFPKYAYGIKKIGNTTIIVSSGIKVFPKGKFNNIFKPEIVSCQL